MSVSSSDGSTAIASPSLRRIVHLPIEPPTVATPIRRSSAMTFATFRLDISSVSAKYFDVELCRKDKMSAISVVLPSRVLFMLLFWERG